jgi:hypothetical protein
VSAEGARSWVRGLVAGVVAALALLASSPAVAFDLDGHEVIEASAYKRLLALDVVPGTGVSGRTLLGSLIETGVLFQPPCFDRRRWRADCGADQRLDLPVLHWPLLRSGGPDLVLDRQLGQQGQCQHFMARTSDAMSPIDPRLGVPVALATTAYSRCIRIAGVVFDGILRDPQLAQWRMVGTYVLMHAIEDSFSAAHVDRDAHFNVVHLLSWTLIDWPVSFIHGRASFPAPTHHAVTDARDGDYVRGDARTADGRACRDIHHPYAYPDECLTERAKAATDAVVDYLIAIYRLRARAIAQGRQASLFAPESDEEVAVWAGFLRAHVRSVAAPVEVADRPQAFLPRPDAFVGVQAQAGERRLGLGAWAGQLFFGPALPFALGVSGTVGYARYAGVGQLGAGVNLSLLLPLVRRLAIGAAPAGFRLRCDVHMRDCAEDVVAIVGMLIVPLGDSLWLGIDGPHWSWTERAFSTSWFGLAFGWSHESLSRRAPPASDAATLWDPPRPDDVRAYRSARATRALYLATTFATGSHDSFVGGGVDWRWDHDRWDRRSGLAPGLQLEVNDGAVDGTQRGGAFAMAPVLRAYVIPSRLALTATPALVRVLLKVPVQVDVAARAGIALEIGRLELAVDSPPLSYVSQSRWHALPFTVRLGLQIE